MKKISFVSGCYNEQENLIELVNRVFKISNKFPEFEFEYIIIDNKSTDSSSEILTQLASKESRLKVILNVRNFGHIRSPYYAMMQATGDAIIYLASDLQDPPEVTEEFILKWKEGWKVVAAIKTKSEESPLFFLVRKLYYELISRLSDLDLLKNFTGFGLYDREVIEHCRKMDDPYPYQRGMISELGYQVTKVYFTQPKRLRGFSKNNFYTLFDIAMLGFTNHTKIPLRLATLLGFVLATIFSLVGLVYLILKLVHWKEFTLGLAPIAVGVFFAASVQLFFIGILGEYVGAIYTKLNKRPLVIEDKRINF
jgi:polyisoprenyl-phosphate glycosyltransferase